jgi:hypothetical protein
MGRKAWILKTNIGISLQTADVVPMEDGRLAYLIQVPPGDEELFNLTGRFFDALVTSSRLRLVRQVGRT